MQLPVDFVNRMNHLMTKEEADIFFESYEKERAYGLRYNPLKIRDEEGFQALVPFETEKIPWCKEGYYYRQEDRPGKLPLHEAGAYYIQEPSAMSAVELLEVKPGERILDLCAAPGGKSTQIAGRMQGKGLLVANEYYAARAKILAQNVERMGVRNAVVTNEDTSHLADCFPEYFHKILIDAPCSGEGMFKKEEEAVTHWSYENVALCRKRQDEILDDGARMLEPGGILVYSTCTFAPLENEQCIYAFLQRHPEFEIEEVEQKYFSPARPEWVDTFEDGRSTEEKSAGRECLKDAVRIWPHIQDGEGHFAVRMRKTGEIEKQKRRYVKTNVRPEQLKEYREFEKKNLLQPMEEKQKGIFYLFGEELYLMPEDMPEIRGMRIERAGLHLGTRKKNRFEPSHALALALSGEEVKQSMECREIEQYLHGETVETDYEKDWVLVCIGGISIGWGKAQQGILKNHYPKGLRR